MDFALPWRCGIRFLLHKPESGAAFRTGYGLGVKAAIQRVLVLLGALFTHGKASHGGDDPVVGNGARYGVTRAAIGAIGEGIEVAVIVLREHVCQTIIAYAYIRAYEYIVSVLAVALHNAKGFFPLDYFRLLCLKACQGGQGREPVGKKFWEGADVFGPSLHLDIHAKACVAHMSSELKLFCQPEDKGAKAYALHLPLCCDAQAHKSLLGRCALYGHMRPCLFAVFPVGRLVSRPSGSWQGGRQTLPCRKGGASLPVSRITDKYERIGYAGRKPHARQRA